jgi:hypothetical protein
MFQRAHKFHAQATTLDGRTFASQLEARRFAELRLLEKAGHLDRLECQPVFVLEVAGQAIGQAIMDFRYRRLVPPLGWVIEDCKGVDTPLSRWKRKHVEAQYGLTVTLVRR